MTNKKINPNLIKLAEMTHNFDLALPDFEMLEKQTAQPDKTTTLFLDKENFVYVPSINLYVAKERTLHGLNWYDTHKELHKQDMKMPTIYEFTQFLKYLKSQPQNQEYQKILYEILTVRNPWRSEWLDADFKVINGKLHINYNHKTINNQLQPQNSEILEECLMEDKTPGISLEDWLDNPTKHGLPRADVKKGSINYWKPLTDNNSVAWFNANCGRAILNCNRYPSNQVSSLGVFRCIAR